MYNLILSLSKCLCKSSSRFWLECLSSSYWVVWVFYVWDTGLRFSDFSWINASQIVASLWLIYKVLKKIDVDASLVFLLPVWSSGFPEVLPILEVFSEKTVLQWITLTYILFICSVGLHSCKLDIFLIKRKSRNKIVWSHDN